MCVDGNICLSHGHGYLRVDFHIQSIPKWHSHWCKLTWYRYGRNIGSRIVQFLDAANFDEEQLTAKSANREKKLLQLNVIVILNSRFRDSLTRKLLPSARTLLATFYWIFYLFGSSYVKLSVRKGNGIIALTTSINFNDDAKREITKNTYVVDHPNKEETYLTNKNVDETSSVRLVRQKFL